MWRRRWACLILLVLLFMLIPTGVSAENSAEVVVTATGYICEAPGGFTVTYISDYEVGLSWTKGVDAENTMVRACIGRYPTDREDGYLVYYGDGTSATDWVNMEFLSVPIYYQAWSQNASGVWEEGGSEPGWVEGVTILLFALMALSLGLTITAYVFKKGALFFGAAGAWLILCIYSYIRMVDATDIYFYLCLLCAALLLVSVIGALTTRETRSAKQPFEEAEDDEIREDEEYFNEARQGHGKYDFVHGRGRTQKQRRTPRRLNF